MTFTITKEAVLFALAIYGAVLSTWNLIKSISKDRRTLRVTIGSKLPVGMGGALDGKAFAHIEATNVGQRPVTVTLIALELKGGQRLFSVQRSTIPGLEDTDLPVTLTDGQAARKHQAYSDIGEALIRHYGKPGTYQLTPCCEDTAGGVYRGEPWSVDALELTRM